MEDLTVCRICLGDGANIPIFSKCEGKDDVRTKISFCMKEEIQDEVGYPRAICKQCKDTLDMVCNFIRTYIISASILQKGLPFVKEEKLDCDDNYHVQSEVEMETNDIKIENPETDDTFVLETSADQIELMQPAEIAINMKPIGNQVSSKKRKLRNNVETEKTKPSKHIENPETDVILDSITSEEFKELIRPINIKKKPIDDKIKKKKLNNVADKTKPSKQMKKPESPEADAKLDSKTSENMRSLKPIRISIKKKPIDIQIKKKKLNNVAKTKKKPLKFETSKDLMRLIRSGSIAVKKVPIDNQLAKIKLNNVAKTDITNPSENMEEENHKSNIRKCMDSDFEWEEEKCDWEEEKTDLIKLKRQKQVKEPKAKNQKSLCELCGQLCLSKALSTHVKKVHHNKPVKCEKCSQLYSSEYYLMAHIKRRHSGERNCVCSKCGRTYAFMKDLRRHIVIAHERGYPKKQYPCELCGKIFASAKSVVMHERAFHTGDRPEKCSVCSATFTHIDYLTEHMRLHTGERPYKCPICGRGHAQRSNMKSHLRVHKISELTPEQLAKMRPGHLKRMKP